MVFYFMSPSAPSALLRGLPPHLECRGLHKKRDSLRGHLAGQLVQVLIGQGAEFLFHDPIEIFPLRFRQGLALQGEGAAFFATSFKGLSSDQVIAETGLHSVG